MVALLLALGLTLPLLGMLGLLRFGPMAAALSIAVIALFAACGVRRAARFALLGAGALLLVGYLTLFDGASMLREVLCGVYYELSGQPAALPMVAQPAAVMTALVCACAAWTLSSRSAGAYPALAVSVLTALLMWLSSHEALLPFLTPALIGAVTHVTLCGHDGVRIGRVLPMIAALVTASVLIVPPGGATLPALKSAADTLRQRILDYLFFTDPRNVFTLASEGFYPQGAGQLGGPAEIDDEPVMIVSTPRKVYLRATARDRYTGRAWLDTVSGRRYLWVSPQWNAIREVTFDMGLPQGRIGQSSTLMAQETVTVRMVAGSASTLFVPQRVRTLTPGGDLVPHFNASGEIFITRDLQPGDTYSVSAALAVGGDVGLGPLVTACAGQPDPHYEELRSLYTALPDHMQQEIFDLADSLTADKPSAYDKAVAIQTYLNRGFRYTLTPPAQPENIDFVANFLLNTKEGYCTYFASAMTVLCRMAGLPARYVEGYLAEPDAGGVARVTGRNGHAWTEVYFPGFGWLTFDATPGQGSASNQPPEEQDKGGAPDELPTPEPPDEGSATATPTPAPEEPQPSPSPAPEEDAPETAPPESDPSPSPKPPIDLSWLWWLLLAALVAAAALRLWLTRPAQLEKRAADESARWSVWTQAVHDALRAAGLPRSPSESPLAYARRIDGTGRFGASLLPLGACESTVFYGHTAPQPEETALARQTYAGVNEALTRRQRVLLALTRAFVPLRKRRFTAGG